MINLKVLKLLIVLLILCSLFQLTIEQELDKREPQAQTSPPAQTPPPSSPPAQTQPPSSPPAQTQPPSSPPAQTAVPTATTPANATTTTNSTTTNSTLPPAGDQPVRIKVINPPLSTNLLLKIGKVQTFNWTYTSQFDPSLAPKSLNVFAIYNDATGYNYTIARDLAPSTTFVMWNTTTSNPELPAGTYTLNIWDEKGPQPGTVIGGQLLPYADLHFVMYKPQQRVDLSSYTCAVCDGNSPITRAEQSKPYLPIAVLGGILVATVLFVIFVKV